MISVVVPVHDEERSVALLYEELQAALEPLGEPWEVVFVDDGSTDGTFAALDAAARRARQRPRRPAAPQLRQGGGAPGRLRAGARATSSSRSTATCRTIRPRSRGCSPSSTRASTSSPAGRRSAAIRSAPAHPVADLQPVTGRLLRACACTTSTAASRPTAPRSCAACGSTASCTASSRCSRTTAAIRVAELPVNHRPREHGRSRYGVERYLRGFLDLLTVTFMGRYRHRPLHLFGGLGLLLGAVGIAILVYLTVREADRRGDRPAAAADARRAARRRRRCSSSRSGSISELITSHHEERAGDARTRRAARRRDPAVALARPLLRDVRARLSAQRPGDLVPAPGGVEVRERHAAVWEGRRAQVDARAPAPRRGSPRPSCGCFARAARATSTRCRRLSRPLRPAGGEAGGAGKARSCSTRSSRCRHARRATAAASPRARRRRALLRRIDRARVPRGRPRRRRHRGRTRDSSPSSPACRASASRSASSARRSAIFQPGWRQPERVPRALRRQADPAARARDDPRGGPARAGAAVPHRRQRPARGARCASAPAERGVGRRGSSTSGCRRSCTARAARSGSSARRRRPAA